MSGQLDQIAAAGRDLRTRSPEDWPLAIAGLSERLERELDEPAVLDQIAREVTDIADRLHCDAIAGASPLGARIARASVAMSTNGLRVFDERVPGATVLVVDGVLASGVQTVRMARSARNLGARQTPAVAVLADPRALERCRNASPDGIIALREL